MRSVLIVGWTLVGIVFALAAWRTKQGWAGLEPASWAVALWCAVTVVAQGFTWAIKRDGGGCTEEEVDDAQRALADLVSKEWQNEIKVRQLKSPQLLAQR